MSLPKEDPKSLVGGDAEPSSVGRDAVKPSIVSFKDRIAQMRKDMENIDPDLREYCGNYYLQRRQDQFYEPYHELCMAVTEEDVGKPIFWLPPPYSEKRLASSYRNGFDMVIRILDSVSKTDIVYNEYYDNVGLHPLPSFQKQVKEPLGEGEWVTVESLVYIKPDPTVHEDSWLSQTARDPARKPWHNPPREYLPREETKSPARKDANSSSDAAKSAVGSLKDRVDQMKKDLEKLHPLLREYSGTMYLLANQERFYEPYHEQCKPVTEKDVGKPIFWLPPRYSEKRRAENYNSGLTISIYILDSVSKTEVVYSVYYDLSDLGHPPSFMRQEKEPVGDGTWVTVESLVGKNPDTTVHEESELTRRAKNIAKESLLEDVLMNVSNNVSKDEPMKYS